MSEKGEERAKISKTEAVENGDHQNGEDDDAPKKRGAKIQLSSDMDPERGFQEEDPTGTWRKADADTIAQRKIVKVKRGGSTTSDKPTPSFNFGIQSTTTSFNFGVNPNPPAEKPAETKEEKTEEKKDESKKTGSIFSIPSTASLLTFGNQAQPEAPSVFGSQFNFGTESTIKAPETTQVFAANPGKQEVTIPADVKVSTGEEDEEHTFQQPAKLFVMQKDPETGKTKWQERGKGNAKVNINKEDNKKARIVMRVNQSLRLILNTQIFASLHFDKASDKSVRFVAPDVDPPHTPIGYLIQFAKPEILAEFLSAVAKFTEVAPTATASVVASKEEREKEKEE